MRVSEHRCRTYQQTGPRGFHAERNIDAFEYAPNLRRFSAYGMLPHPTPVVPWIQLTHFRLQIERMRELEVLRQATNLQDLEICTGGSFTTGEEYTSVSPVPSLTLLTLSSMKTSGTSPEIRFMFSLLSVPNFVDLHLIYAKKTHSFRISKPRI